MTKLSDFMADMRDSKDLVTVSEKQLREYVKKYNVLENIVKEQAKTIRNQESKIDNLRTKLELNTEQINLFA